VGVRFVQANLLVDNVADTRLSQLEHSFQTAEILRAAYPKDDWLHLVGLIHGLGKLLCHEECAHSLFPVPL
jgi:predicted HD phosphohydrolase